MTVKYDVSEAVKIMHGIPTHDFHIIVVPPSVVKPEDAMPPDGKRPVFEFEDPRTGDTFSGEIYSTLTYTIEEFLKSSTLCYLAYGKSANKIAAELQRRYPEILETQRLRYVVFRKL